MQTLNIIRQIGDNKRALGLLIESKKGGKMLATCHKGKEIKYINLGESDLMSAQIDRRTGGLIPQIPMDDSRERFITIFTGSS